MNLSSFIKRKKKEPIYLFQKKSCWKKDKENVRKSLDKEREKKERMLKEVENDDRQEQSYVDDDTHVLRNKKLEIFQNQ